MKVVRPGLKNQSKFSIIDNRRHEDGVTVTIKLACDNDIAAAEYGQSVSESD